MIWPCSVKISDMRSEVFQMYNKKCSAEESETNCLPEISVVSKKISSKEKFANCSPLHSDNSEILLINLVESEEEYVSTIDQDGPAPVYEIEEMPSRKEDAEIESFILLDGFEDLQSIEDENEADFVKKEEGSGEGCIKITVDLEEAPSYNVVICETEEAPPSFHKEIYDLPDSSTDILQEPDKQDQNNINCSSCQINFKTVREKYNHFQNVHVPRSKYTRCNGRRRLKSNVERLKSLENEVNDYSKVALKCIFTKICTSFFQSFSEREEHILENHKYEKFFRCNSCQYITNRKDSMEMHLQRMHGTENLKCPRFFKSKYSLKYHTRRSHSVKRICNHCKQKIQTLGTHRRVKICKFCNNISPCKGIFQTHLLICSKRPSVKTKSYQVEYVHCFYCSKKLSRYSLSQHMRLLHPQLKFKCTFKKCIHFFFNKKQMEKAL